MEDLTLPVYIKRSGSRCIVSGNPGFWPRVVMDFYPKKTKLFLACPGHILDISMIAFEPMDADEVAILYTQYILSFYAALTKGKDDVTVRNDL